MSIAMIGALAMVVWLVALAFGPLPTFASILAPSDNTKRLALILGMMPIVCIVVLLCAIRLARLAVPRSNA
jgi:Na+/proline symporter